MGKKLIIKGADFSANALEPSEPYIEISPVNTITGKYLTVDGSQLTSNNTNTFVYDIANKSKIKIKGTLRAGNDMLYYGFYNSSNPSAATFIQGQVGDNSNPNKDFDYEIITIPNGATNFMYCSLTTGTPTRTYRLEEVLAKNEG